VQYFKFHNHVCKIGSCEPYHAPFGATCHPCARTCYGQCLCQIWSSYIHPLQQHETQCWVYRMGWFGRLRIKQGHRQCHHLVECIRPPIRRWQKLCLYLVLFPCYSELYLSKVTHFNLPHLHLVPLLEWNFAEIFGIPGLSYSTVCVILHLAILEQYRHVTDTHTHTHTHDNGIYHTSIASHGKNDNLIYVTTSQGYE